MIARWAGPASFRTALSLQLNPTLFTRAYSGRALPKPFFTPSFHRPGFFTSRFASQLAIPRTISHQQHATEIPKSMSKWLYGCSVMVFGIVVIGGLTRLTESGLSITEWQPISGIVPPLTDQDWQVEWEKYRTTPEGVLMNSQLEMQDFKKIFYMEWGHRVAGRMLGLAFILPAGYYAFRYRLPGSVLAKLSLIGVGIGAQGALGWFMVKSGLDEEIIDNRAVPRVSQYRLAAHLGAALALFIGMVATAASLRRAPTHNSMRRFALGAGGAVFLTAMSGAFVAGLDAGLVYNEFPTMGGRLVPPRDELLDPRYAKEQDKRDVWWRNMLENPVTAQFDHRLLATSTFAFLLTLPYIARRKRVDARIRKWADITAGAAVAQVTLGITTLLYMVPIPLAAMHQAGSVVLLFCATMLASL